MVLRLLWIAEPWDVFGGEEWLFLVMDCRGERNSGFWLEQKVESGAFCSGQRWGGTGLGEKSGV